jgi:hypothetical protein
MKAKVLPALFFNYHDLVGIKITTDDPRAAQFYAEECQRHRVDLLADRIPHVDLIFHRLRGGVPYGFTWHTHKLVARWAYRISIASDKVTIEAYGNTPAIPMIHHMLVHHSLRYLASCQKVLMLHAGAVAYRGHSLILTGQGGVGKTTLTSLILSKGGAEWAVHADDYVFLTPAGESLAYLTRAHVYRSLFGPVPEIKRVLTVKERLRVEIWWRFRTWLGIKWPVRVPLNRLWPEHPLAMCARPAGLVILQREDVSQPVLHRLAADEVPIDDLLKMNFNEARHYLDLTRPCLPAVEWQALVDDWRQREKDILEQFVQSTPVYKLGIPAQVEQVDNDALFASLAGLAGLTIPV